jgi:cytochrome b6
LRWREKALKRRYEIQKPGILQARTVSWFRERIDLEPVAACLGNKTVPIHRHSWIYLLGGAALFLLGLQVASGVLLMLYYQPTEAAAYASVHKIMYEVPYGWLIRSIHVWGAHLFIVVVCLHFLTVLFTRGYRRPRELTWVSGALLLALALGAGFSGYLLPWNELSYFATRVGTAIPGSIPIIGNSIVLLLRGGAQVSGETITRFYAVHVMIVPLTFGAALAIHLILVQMQGMSLPLGMAPTRVKDQRPFFSEFVLLDLCLWLLLFGMIVALSVFLPAEIGVEANLLQPAPEGIQPEWYFLFMFETLKRVPEWVGVGLFAALGLFLLLVPFLDRNAARGEKSPTFMAVFVMLVAYAVVFQLLAWMDDGLEHPREELVAATYSLSWGIVSLVLFWSVIGFLIFYLWQLLRENTRIRRLRDSRSR